MKSKIFFLAMLGLALTINQPAKAQLNISLNIGSQPLWGPTGYDHVDYYYLPDIGAYYDVPTQQFIYLEGRNWVFRRTLPPRYANYNLYNSYKVVINSPKPYLRNNVYAAKYKNHGAVRQTAIRDSRDSKYFVVKGHPKYNGGRPVQRPNVQRPNVNRPGRNDRPGDNRGDRGNRGERGNKDDRDNRGERH